MRILVAVSLALVVVAGCKQGTSTPAAPTAVQAAGPAKVFALRGTVVSTDPAGGTITVSHGDIPGFMEAMTMAYKVVQTSRIAELRPGDMITAKVLVDADGYSHPRLDEIVVVGQAKPGAKPDYKPMRFDVVHERSKAAAI